MFTTVPFMTYDYVVVISIVYIVMMLTRANSQSFKTPQIKFIFLDFHKIENVSSMHLHPPPVNTVLPLLKI